MEDDSSVSLVMARQAWESLLWGGEHAWLVHVVPGMVSAGGTNELVIAVKVSPEVLSLLVEEVNPD